MAAIPKLQSVRPNPLRSHRPFTWRCTRVSGRSHLWCSCRRLRSTGRATCCLQTTHYDAGTLHLYTIDTAYLTLGQPSTQHVTHVYNTADPIPMGTCTGVSSSCALAGVALETRCHLGQVIRYDTVTKLGWSANIIHHGIQAVIDGVLSRDDIDWSDEDGKNRTVPALTTEDDCVVCNMRVIWVILNSTYLSQDCFNWEFGNYRNVSRAGCAGGNH